MTDCALVFTDVVDSTAVVERLGDDRAATLWTAHDRKARDLLAGLRGREIDRTDGFFLVFESVVDAAGYAVAYHRAIAELGLTARAALHHGSVVERRNLPGDVAQGAKPVEIEGLAKPFAARLLGLARGGQTLLSADAAAALGASLPQGCRIQRHGHFRMKGIEAPVEVFELGAADAAGFVPPADADKAYQVVRTGDVWRPVRSIRHNLSPERDAFVGRQSELRTLASRFESGARLVTVLGPGGIGKTRLVHRYCLSWLGDWPGGVSFCDLSEARSADGICFAVALALGVPLGAGDPAGQLGHAIAARGRCLVVLDNFEQAVAHGPATLGTWLDRAAQASFVVTSRELLHLGGEEVFALDPLPLQSDALDLFAARARAQRAGFEVDRANRATVAEVVRLLDGLPLAIELAAARVRVLSPEQLVARLKDRFKVLAGVRGATARQATLKAAIDWSWDLLVPWERVALAQCSVFEGGFTLEAAEAVLDLAGRDDAPPAADAIQALVDKSLLRTWSPADAGRYDHDEPYFAMYLSIHDYAAEKLLAGPAESAQAAERRHGEYFARFGADASLEAMSSRGGVARLRALTLELENVVAACRRATARGDAPTAVGTYRAAWEVLDRRGPFAPAAALGTQVLAMPALEAPLRSAVCVIQALALRRIGRAAEAGALLEQALALARATGMRAVEALALAQRALLHAAQGRMEASRADAEAALALQRALGDRRREGSVLNNLGGLHVQQGRSEEARACYEAALAIHRQLGHPRAEGGVLSGLAVLHHDQGRMDEARAHYEAALAILRDEGDRLSEGIVAGNLATLHNDQGHLEAARAAYADALAIARDIGDRLGECVTLGNVGKLAHDLGQDEEAQAHYRAALAIARELGSRREEGIALGSLGSLHTRQGRLAEGRKHYLAALAIHRETGNRRFEGEALCNLGDVLVREGRAAESFDGLREGETLLREIGDPLDLAKLLCVRGRAEAATGAADAAAATLAEVTAMAAALRIEPGSELHREMALLQHAVA